MGVIDSYLMNHDAIEKGFKAIIGINEYLLVTDANGNFVCLSYDMDSCRTIIEEYLKRQNLDKTLMKFEVKSLKNKDEILKDIIKYKIVLLDGELVLYKDVEKKALEFNIKGFTGKFPKFGINRYTTT